MAGIKYAKFGDYMTKTKGGKDSSASSSYGSNPGGGGGAGYSAPSAAPSDNEIKNTKNIKTKLKDSLQNIVDNKGGQGYETAPGIVAIPTMGKNTGKFKKIEDKLKAGIPLSGGEQAIADFYLSSAVNPYAAKMQQFKEQPGGMAAFKEKFPNPLAVIAGGIGDFFKKGTLLGKFLTSLNKSDQNKVDIITNDPQGVKQGPPAYDVNQYGLGDMGPDKILRDLMRQSQQNTIAPYGIPNPGAEASDAGIMTVNQENEARKRQMVADYFNVDVSGMSQSTIDKSFKFIMDKMTPNEDNMMGTGSNINYSPDYSNFKEEIVDEVVDDRYQAGPNEDNMMNANIFELGSGNLAGSVSETDYTAPNIEGTNPRGQVSSARSTPLIGGDPNVPYGYEENMLDVLAEDNMANGGYMSSFPNQNLNTQSLSASDNIDDRIMKNLQFEKMSPGMMGYNAGGYAGMSTFDKLKMIADSGYQS
jgi:hypothetical protein